MRAGRRAAASVLGVGLLAGCSILGPAEPVDPIALPGGAVGAVGEPEGWEDWDDWIVVRYVPDADWSPMLELLPVEDAAEAALVEAEVGFIDGNEIGRRSYDLYFVGSDHQAMWDVLEPVLAESPRPWRWARLLDGLEDPTPTVVRPEGWVEPAR